MKCPADGTNLVMSDRQGVEIDYCPECRGVWLDRGELDKIIDRNASYEASHHPQQPTGRDRNYDQAYDERSHPNGKKHKREGFLGDLFDFGD